MKAPRVTPLEGVSTYAPQGIRVRGVENPQVSAMMNADLLRRCIRKSHPAFVLISARRSNTTAAMPEYYKSYSINLRRFRKIPGSLLFRTGADGWTGAGSAAKAGQQVRRRCMPYAAAECAAHPVGKVIGVGKERRAERQIDEMRLMGRYLNKLMRSIVWFIVLIKEHY